jgi:hypothetical protein
MGQKPLERRTWFVATICVVALLATWASLSVVYEVLPHGTPLAHCGLFALALGSTAGLIITLERLVPLALAKRASMIGREVA